MEEKSVMSELSEGMKLANELKRKMIDHTSTNSTEASSCGLLVEKIVSCYDNALALLNCMDLLTTNNLSSEINSDQDSKDHNCKHANKKRKSSSSPGLSEQVKVSSDTGFGGQIDDGYYWRKYGQKDILGANHPRAYYRCTHRYSQGCSARKQVQQVEESVFEVVYKGNHTCTQQPQFKHNKRQDDHVIINSQLITQENPINENAIDLPPISSPDSSLSTGDLDVLIDQVDFYYHSLEAAGFF